MARSLEPLVVGKVIGEVLDMYNPVAEFTVHYGSKQIANGCEIKPSAAVQMPRAQILGSRLTPSLYTLVMVDPDAPSPSDPKWREWLHWIAVDIPEGSDATKGIHRYVFAVFKQGEALNGRTKAPEGRGNFSTRQFAAQNGLGLPVAAVYFNSQKEPAVKKR
ncbi:phosphatidylethanolamine-binding protein, putative [Ricinus communis]|uniref:Phosphatidylethanolamine-binding protein, putative n=1 Tax=Ricinus communis TaxID=3988 RepID=B9SFC9_RICCO|nr:phosphatidylethanolamine-binding protein, putative [Ricinus communis]